MVAAIHGVFSPEVQNDERRMFVRKEVFGRVQGKRLSFRQQQDRMDQLSLALRDISAGGLSAITQTPLFAGEPVAIFFRHRALIVAGIRRARLCDVIANLKDIAWRLFLINPTLPDAIPTSF